MPTGHLLTNLLPIKSVKLGRLVLNARCPHQDNINPLDPRPEEAEIIWSPQTPYHETRKFSKCSKLLPYLDGILSFTCETQNTGVATLDAPEAKTYDLKNSKAWFESACAQPETRKFLEAAIDNQDPVYLIVGFRTVQDGRLVIYVNRRASQRGKIGVPVQTLVALTNTPATILTPGLGGIRHTSKDQDLDYTAPGEQVFAILYRKVKFKWFFSRDIKNMALEPGNRWKTCWDWRKVDDDDDKEENVLEATLADDDSDLEIPDEEYPDEDMADLLQESLDLACMENDLENGPGDVPETSITDTSVLAALDKEHSKEVKIDPPQEPLGLACVSEGSKSEQSDVTETNATGAASDADKVHAEVKTNPLPGEFLGLTEAAISGEQAINQIRLEELLKPWGIELYYGAIMVLLFCWGLFYLGS